MYLIDRCLINVLNKNRIHNMKLLYYTNIFLRFIYISYIFISEFIKYKFNNTVYCIKEQQQTERIELIKKIVNKLEDLNIVYVKIFQSTCINNNLLNEDEQNYFIKYTDNVPYKTEEIDYTVLDKLEKEYDIKLENTGPINSGIVSVVFNARYGIDSKKVVIKILKKNIKERLVEVFNEIKLLADISSYIPYIRNYEFVKIVENNKELIINQTDFLQESNNIKIFKEKNKNLPEFRIPFVYDGITNKYKNVLVMENIKGMTYTEIKNFDPKIKDIFGRLIYKFAVNCIFYHNIIHCDVHPGNIFFYINEDDNLPKYQLGFIDFGICSFPSKENQYLYYTFFYEIQCKNDFTNLKKNIHLCIEEKNIYKNMSDAKKNELEKDFKDWVKEHLSKDELLNPLNLIKILNKYGLTFTKEFNQIGLSIQIANSLMTNLSINIIETQDTVLNELMNVNKLIEII